MQQPRLRNSAMRSRSGPGSGMGGRDAARLSAASPNKSTIESSMTVSIIPASGMEDSSRFKSMLDSIGCGSPIVFRMCQDKSLL